MGANAHLLPFTTHRVELRPGVWTASDGGDDPLASRTTQIVLDRSGGTLRGRRALDLGCLEGGYTVAFARLGATEAVGIEARRRNVDRCEFLRETLELENVRFHRADVREISLEWLGHFDVVFAQGILYHLDDPFGFLDRVSSLTSDFALIDTHVARYDSWAHGCSDKLAARVYAGRQYVGREAFEYPETMADEEVEELPWAAYGNPRSFWLTEDSLVEALHAVGFPYVSKVYMPRPYRCGEGCTTECRVVLVAKKAWGAAPALRPGDSQ